MNKFRRCSSCKRRQWTISAITRIPSNVGPIYRNLGVWKILLREKIKEATDHFIDLDENPRNPLMPIKNGEREIR